jgi:hypothetical protein
MEAVVENHLARERLFRREINCFFASFAIAQCCSEPPRLPGKPRLDVSVVAIF